MPEEVRCIEDCSARAAATKLSDETQQTVVEWVIRVGIGPLYLQQTRSPHTVDEIEALLNITFDPADPVHRDLADTIDIWRCELGQEENCQ